MRAMSGVVFRKEFLWVKFRGLKKFQAPNIFLASVTEHFHLMENEGLFPLCLAFPQSVLCMARANGPATTMLLSWVCYEAN